MGVGGSDNVIAQDLPLFIAFAVLAAYTYSSGLRAPALIAFVKDFLIYLVIIVATVWMAWKVGFGGALVAETFRTVIDMQPRRPGPRFLAALRARPSSRAEPTDRTALKSPA